jgi:uncharacterized protein YxjI
MNYPLELSFKIMAVNPQLSVVDADGKMLFYVKQKAFKLKEAVTVFADETQTRPVAKIDADRIIDISANYTFSDPSGRVFGSIKRQGMRSLWKAHYELKRDGATLMEINEENGWVKVADSLLNEIPIIGLLSGYVFHPCYLVTRPGSVPVLRFKKQPAFFEGKFKVEKLGALDTADEALAVLGLLMMILLERRSG